MEKRKAYWYKVNENVWAYVDSKSEEVIRIIKRVDPYGFWAIEQKEVDAVRYFVDVDWAKHAVELLYAFQYDVIRDGD